MAYVAPFGFCVLYGHFTLALCVCLQQVFMIKPIENSPQCMTWVPYTKSVHEDAVLFGDDQGYVSSDVMTSLTSMLDIMSINTH